MPNPKWLEWANRIQAIAQNGLAYTEGPFDVERYHALRWLAAEIVADYTTVAIDDVHDLFARQTGYTTPKVDVRGAVFRDGKVLLVRERSDGCWTLPGGWVDIYDPPSAAVAREILEESGYRARAIKLAALWDRDAHGAPPNEFHIYKAAFICELIDDTPLPVTGDPASAKPATENIETDGVDWFPPDALPPLSLTRIMPEQIARLFDHARQMDLPADFD